MQENIIEMRHITKLFPGIIANDDVSISVRRGEIYALLGENGAGKSTLMSMLFGMYQPDVGQIFINGEEVHFHSANDAAAHNIGMVHQHFKLVDNFTVAENIVLGMEPVKKQLGFLPALDLNRANQEISALSKKYGLEVNPTDKIEDLPVSVKQRVEILKMLYRHADILIFDEPTALLTPQEIDFLLDIMKNMRDEGKTIILITHKIDEIKKAADRCAILAKGKLIDVLDVKTTTKQTLANLMVGHQVELTSQKSEQVFGEKLLSVQNLCLRNKDKVEVLKNLSFEIRAGEIFAIAGVSGNGQTELADVIAGLVKPTSGKIFLAGQDITDSSIRERNQLGLSYVPEDRQGTGLLMDFSLADNLVLRKYYQKPFAAKGIRYPAEIDAYANQLIDKYDIRSGRGKSTIARSMSGGNQQKAIIGREIEQHGKLDIFVQPTRGLDIGAIEKIHKSILEERKAGVAILLISLELDEIMELADTIGVIFGGELIKIAPAESVTVQEVGRYMAGVRA